MKAFLLAAGRGIRLRPITDHTPKCMLKIGGSTLLDTWLDALARSGVDEVLVNVHHLPNVVCNHLARRPEPPVIRIALEPELLGSAGTLAAHRAWVDREELFLACNADNLTDFDLRLLIRAHRARNAFATLALFRAPEPSACGIVRTDDTGKIIDYVEKPREPAGDLANAGMYAFHPRVLDNIVGQSPLDIGYHLLPRLVGRAYGVMIGGYFRDIGTPEAYQSAQQEWPRQELR